MGLKTLLTNLETGKLAYPNHDTPSDTGGFNYSNSTSMFDVGFTFNQKSFKFGEGTAFDRRGDYSREPFITVDLEDIERSGLFKGIDTYTDGFIRGGAATAVSRAVTDTKRISSWLLTGKGIAWLVKQVGLQASNPQIMRGSVANQRTYNLGINTLAQIPASITGLHIKREGLTPLSFEGYADEPDLFADGDSNRLIRLHQEHIEGHVNPPTSTADAEADKERKWYQKVVDKIGSAVTGDKKGVELYTQAGGASSYYGLGNTTIRKFAPFITDANAVDQSGRTLPLNSFLVGEFGISLMVYRPGLDQNFGKYLYAIGLESDEIEFGYLQDDVTKPTNVNEFTGKYRKIISDQNRAYSTQTRVNDFRYRLGGTHVGSDYWTKVKGSWWKTYHRESRVNMGNPGVRAPSFSGDELSSYIRKKSSTGQLDYSVQNFDKVDVINAMDIVSSEKHNSHWIRDLVKFRIEAVDNDDPSKSKMMVFRAFLDTFSDAYNAQHNEFRYNGRAEPFYTYEGFSREINFGFKIAAQTRYEMKPLYRKLNYLVSQTAPEYRNGRMRAPYVKLTIGSMIDRIPGLMGSVTLTWQKDYPWEISISSPEEGLDKKMLVLPHVLDVSCKFTPLHNFTPQRSIHAPFILPHEANRSLTTEQKWYKKGAYSSYDLGIKAAFDAETINKMDQIFKTDKDMEESVTAIDPVELKQIETDSPDMQLATPNTIPPSKEEIRAQRKAEREEARAQRKADRAQRKADRKQAREDRKKGKTEEPQPKTTIDNLGAGHINLITLNDSQETNGVSV